MPLGGDGKGKKVRCLVKVQDDPVPDLHVTIERADEGSSVTPLWDAKTDAKGRFELNDVPPGKY
ncbi:MAG: carboxypeptidase-like regulatory domain-containing protein, partial [Planctomycetota bacterium]|nr:carboxypeptidase-like regulatory domain-containing protein [Planctomycetota bacterium]